MNSEKAKELKRFSKHIQIETIKEIANLGVGHLGGSLSIADLLAVLYGKQMKVDPKNPKWEERDWLVVSKGHAGPAVYATLALKGYFSIEELKTLNQPTPGHPTNFPSHCDRTKTPGIDMTTGSLGQGASSAAGIALAHKMDGSANYTYVIFGDGEIDEGQVWEMALFAHTKKLSKLIAFVDNNGLQIDGKTEDVCDLMDIAAKFDSFGWYAQTVDGHDVEAIDAAIERAKAQDEKPSVIVLKTVKGHGWSAIENTAGCHSMNVNAQQLEEALAEMNAALESI
jgi:transketolase